MPTPSLTDAFRRRCPNAWCQIIHDSEGRLRAAARRVTRNQADCEDAIQDGLLSALQAAHRFTGDCSPTTWLYSIVVNAARMQARSETRRRKKTENAAIGWVEKIGEDHDPAHEAERRDTIERVRRAVRALPQHYREAIALHDLEGLSSPQAAATTSVSVANFKARVVRGRKSLAYSLSSFSSGRNGHHADSSSSSPMSACVARIDEIRSSGLDRFKAKNPSFDGF
ncbi:MAG: RNA polymerase sigma factor [Tepidisphaeraceae bacterium]